MSHSIGYFISKNAELIEQMQESWGSRFEMLNVSEKLFLLSYIIGSLTAAPSAFYEPEDIADIVQEAGERMGELSLMQRLDLAKAVIYQIEAQIIRDRV